MQQPNCPSCDQPHDPRHLLDHCHGTLIVHPSGSTECTEPECFDFTHARHTFIVDCADIVGGCACLDTIRDTIQRANTG